ncbi:hypothetical protein ACS0TY_012929 [Phlomoides rotata]
MEFSFNYVPYLVDPRLTVLRRPIKNLRQLKRNPISTTSSSDWLVTYTGDTVERPYIEDSSHLEGIISLRTKSHFPNFLITITGSSISIVDISCFSAETTSASTSFSEFTSTVMSASTPPGNNGRPDFENDVFFREVEVCFVREHPNGILGSGLRSQGLTVQLFEVVSALRIATRILLHRSVIAAILLSITYPVSQLKQLLFQLLSQLKQLLLQLRTKSHFPNFLITSPGSSIPIVDISCFSAETTSASTSFSEFTSTVIRATMADPDFEHNVFFREVEVYFLREHLNAIMGSRFRIQGRTDTCYAFACVNCIYADLHIHKGESLRASEQLLLDCLHIDYPPNGGLHERKPGAGYPNSFKNAFLYAISNGLLLDKNYPWVGRFKECERCKKKEADLIFSGMYEHLWSADDVLEALRRPGAVAAFVYATRRFKWWKGTNIYTMTNEEREEIEEMKKKSAATTCHHPYWVWCRGRDPILFGPELLGHASWPQWFHKDRKRVCKNFMKPLWPNCGPQEFWTK